jgi:outer membrane protein assembly factor BamB
VRPDWPTYHGNFARTGVSTSMPALRRLRVVTRVQLDGAVYASPVVGGGRTFVATENDSVYAFDALNRRLWRVHLGPPSPASERSCGNIDPLGITGTPVYTDGTLFVAAEYGGPVRHELVAISAVTGGIRWRKSLDLPGVDATVMQQRGALAVASGRVWVAFGGLDGDCGAYKGRVLGVREDGDGTPVSFTVPTTARGGIWTPPGPVVDPTSGLIYVSVGNGAAGPKDPYDHSDSVLALDQAASMVDSFSPTTWAEDNDADQDLGSQGPAIVGPWVFVAGKSGTGYVLERGHLGGIGGQVSSARVCRSYGGAAVDGDVVYVPCSDGVRAAQIDSTGQLRVIWHAADSIAGSPVVGGGRVWSLDQQGGVLHALDPSSGSSVAEIDVGMTSRFATPAISGADLFVPTLTGFTVVAVA